MEASLVIIGTVLALYSLVARRLQRSVVTGPMVFTAVGIVIGPEVLDLVDLTLDDDAIETLLTVTLAVVLYVDATHIDVTALRRGWAGPARLLGISFPLMLLFGFGAGAVLFPDLGLFAVAALATILAPTDAALGQAVVSNPRVPLGVRQTLSVESGLNDGLALPVLLAVLAIEKAEEAKDPTQVLVDELVKEVGLGLVFGIGVGLLLVGAVRLASRWGLDARPVNISIAGLGALAAAAGAAQATGGSVLVAAFVLGLVAAPTLKPHGEHVHEFPEELMGILTLLAFVVFGGLILSSEFDTLDWQIALYATLSLVVLRPVATWIGAWRSGAALPTVGFVGWFGPRGLASILFVAIVLRKSPEFAGLETINSIMAWTVTASIVAHGLSAWPGSNRYARWVARNPETVADGPESRELPAGAVRPLTPESPPRG